VKAYSVTDYGGGMSVGCTASPCICWRGRIVFYGIISSCKSAASSETVKGFWSPIWLV